MISSRDNSDIIIEYMNQGFVQNFYARDVTDDDMQLIEMVHSNDGFPTIKKTELLRNFFGKLFSINISST